MGVRPRPLIEGVQMTVRRLLSLLAVLSLLLAACGGDDDSADVAEVDTTQTTEAGSDSDTESDTDTSEIEGPDDDGEGSSPELPAGVDLGECGFLVDFFDMWDEGESMMSSDDVFSSESYARWADGLERTAANAPAEIRSDFEVMADTFGQVAEAFEDLDIDFSDPEAMYTDPAAIQALEEMGQIFEDPRFDEASEAIDQWMEANCPDLVG